MKGRRTALYARRLVEVINGLPIAPDFIIHTGDVATDPSAGAYEQAREIFSGFKAPLYFATGNHDNSRDIRSFLKMGPCEMANDDPNCLAYAFSMKGFRFITLDARGPDSIDPHGVLTPTQLEFLRREATPQGEPLIVFTHYPVLPFYSQWFDANMRILNGDEMHRILVGARGRVRGVFYGHVHQSMQSTRDGITYTSVPSCFLQFGSWPNDELPSFDMEYLPGFNTVTLTEQDTIVRQHTFPAP